MYIHTCIPWVVVCITVQGSFALYHCHVCKHSLWLYRQLYAQIHTARLISIGYPSCTNKCTYTLHCHLMCIYSTTMYIRMCDLLSVRLLTYVRTYVCGYSYVLVTIHLIQEQLRLQLVSEEESHKTQLEKSEKEREAVQVCAHMYILTYVHICAQFSGYTHKIPVAMHTVCGLVVYTHVRICWISLSNELILVFTNICPLLLPGGLHSARTHHCGHGEETCKGHGKDFQPRDNLGWVSAVLH